MPIEPTKRINPTKTPARGLVRTLRFNVPLAGVTKTIPDKIDRFILKNVGAASLRMSFAGDAAGDYWTIGAGEVSPSVAVAKDLAITLTAVTSPTTVEVLIFGD